MEMFHSDRAYFFLLNVLKVGMLFWADGLFWRCREKGKEMILNNHYDNLLRVSTAVPTVPNRKEENLKSSR